MNEGEAPDAIERRRSDGPLGRDEDERPRSARVLVGYPKGRVLREEWTCQG